MASGGFLGPLAQMGLVGLVVILGLVLAFIVGSKWLSKQLSDEDRADTEDRMRDESKSGSTSERVALRDQPKRWPVTTKLFWAAIIGFLAIGAYGTYVYAQTGSPSSIAYATELTAGGYAVVLIAMGVWITRKQDAKSGELTVIYEQENANHQDSYQYEVDRIQKHTYEEAGEERTALLLPLLSENRLFGLFWKRLLSHDQHELRDRDHRRPEDRALARVEVDDESVTWDQEANELTVRARSRDTVDNPNKHWDYEFAPSKRRSEAEVSQLQQDKEELRQLVLDLRRRIGILSENMATLETELQNADHFGSERLQEQFKNAMALTMGLDRGQMEMLQLDPNNTADETASGFAPHPGASSQNGTGGGDESSAD
ncbi:hypothetical protein [Halorubellus sp. PRR65]|uniref:hypothetical protein n=1 Tax=Halorubellus sp. PRR65 TaxID=3098148 RepID=UPI002B259683|nr:hypothetical protein [Halorubellus sp. PRR65]